MLEGYSTTDFQNKIKIKTIQVWFVVKMQCLETQPWDPHIIAFLFPLSP